MKIIHNRNEKYIKSFDEWKKWYAWYPVSIGGNITVWLDWVERRRKSAWHKETYWEYRLLKD